MRQYTSRIQRVYGRDYLASDWIYGNHPIREVMNQEKIKVSELVRLATEQKCQYIIVERSKETIGKFEKYRVIKIGETTNYDIYRNYRVDIKKRVTRKILNSCVRLNQDGRDKVLGIMEDYSEIEKYKA